MNKFFARRFVVQALFIGAALLLLVRLFYLQVIDDSYFLSGQNNVLQKNIIFPARGTIVDRNNRVLAQNEIIYDIMVIPREVKNIDTLAFCELLGIDTVAFNLKMKKARIYSPVLASPFEKFVSARRFAPIQEKLSEFPGFFKQSRTVRSFPDSAGAHFIGYTAEATPFLIEKSNNYYRPQDIVGITGVERSYEELLRGTRGVANVMRDARGRAKGSYAGGKYDTLAIAGDQLISSLDLRIQKLGEQLMQNKVGSIVAIEPATGEILAYVSSPGYDPNLMNPIDRAKNFGLLALNPYKPLLNRPIQGGYSPGSSFKPLDGLIGLQEGVITPSTIFHCPGFYMAGNRRVRCEHVDGATNLSHAIKMSCNTYFCTVFEKLMTRNGPKNTRASFIAWREKVAKFGLGDKLGIDLPSERYFKLPSAELYDKAYGKGRWRSSSIISLAIGQGELDVTPLQLANIEAIIANRGYFYTPHLIKSIGEKDLVKPEYKVRHDVGIDQKHFEPIINGMQQVVDAGTAYNARIPGIVMCGKTGTVQNPRGKNHSVFVAFAPRDNPKIAIAVIVENAGYGSSYAAPIASYLVEKYLTDSVSKPKAEVTWMMAQNLMPDLPGVRKRPLPGQPADSTKRDSAKGDAAAIRPRTTARVFPKTAIAASK